MSDTTDLMGVRTDAAPVSDASAAPASGAATGSAPRRRRSGTGLEGMVLAELQQVAQALCDAVLNYQASLKKVTTVASRRDAQ